MNFNKGFTLIELVIVVAVIAVLYGIVLFSTGQYVSKGKDSNIAGRLAVLVPAGEAYYNANGNSYDGFCNADTNSVIKNAAIDMPQNVNGSCTYSETIVTGQNISNGNPAAMCCVVQANYYQAWAACAKEFTDSGEKAYCVDSRGVKEEIASNACTSSMDSKCP